MSLMPLPFKSSIWANAPVVAVKKNEAMIVLENRTSDFAARRNIIKRHQARRLVKSLLEHSWTAAPCIRLGRKSSEGAMGGIGNTGHYFRNLLPPPSSDSSFRRSIKCGGTLKTQKKSNKVYEINKNNACCRACRRQPVRGQHRACLL